MEHKRNKTYPARNVEEVYKTTCDLCQADLETNNWDHADVTIECKTGYTCPSGGKADYQQVDMCVKCFDSRLVPWLKTQGVEKLRETHTDW